MLDRKTPPPFVHSTSFDLIVPARAKLTNNLDLFMVSGGSQEVLKLELLFHAGRWYEGQPGASNFSGNLLTKGTRSKTSFQIAQAFDRYGAHVEIQPGFDFVSVAVYTVTQYIRPVLDLFVEIVSDAVFPERELEQHKTIFIQNLKVNEEKTSYLASKAFRKKLFGEDHPYGREVEENHANTITREALDQHYKSFYKNPVVFVSGKISSETSAVISNAFQQFELGPIPERKNTPAKNVHFEEHIKKEGSVQASIRTGKRSVMRSHQDYASVVFACHILGGYFGSRLMKNIREEKGLTYGIHASLHPLQHDSFVLIGADVDKENIELTLTEIRKELKTLRAEKIDTNELETAKNHFIGSLQSEITTPFAHADKLKSIFLSGLPHDFYQQMILRVNDMTAENIMAVCETYLHEDSFSTVSVG
jgi:zinc protease